MPTGSQKKRATLSNEKIVISGASGFVGRALISFLRNQGKNVVPLSRQAGPFYWNPEKGELNPELLEGVEALINLSGENIASGLWTKKKKERILKSRVETTELLRKTISQLKQPPKVFISTSAVGFYGNKREEWVDEDSIAGECFLSDVCKSWEAALLPIETSPTRIVILRLGVVLNKQGGMLKRMLLPFKLGLGVVMGSGEQSMSWISLEELCKVVSFVLSNESLYGPVNAVAPHPVTNRELTKTLGKVLSRPTCLSVPTWILKKLPGGMAEALFLSSLKVYPKKLLSAGYVFLTPYLHQLFDPER